MKKFTILAVLALFVWACGGDANNSDNSSSSGDEVNYAKVSSGDINGAVLYKNNCIACHMATGEGGVAGAKDLRESKLSVDERAKMIHYGSETNATMVAFGKNGTLEPEEIKAIAEYTMKFK